MRLNFQLLLLSCIIAVNTYSQEAQTTSLHIGDPAPSLHMRSWIKGDSIQKFEKGKVYVLEFWATWCHPCIAQMPHLSALAAEYGDKVTILAVDIMEEKTTPVRKIKSFVDSMGQKMNFHVAAEENNLMAANWLNASGEQSIPKSFVVNGDGKLAWVGYPSELDKILRKIVNNEWNLKQALAKHELDKRLAIMDDSAYEVLIAERGNAEKPDKFGKQDSALLMIDQMVTREPGLKYTVKIGEYTFSTLLQVDQQKAYQYGKMLLANSTYENPTFYGIVDAIQLYSYKLNLPSEIYELCAEAYQVRIDQYPEIADSSNLYHKIAEWYWRACNRPKAIDAEQKAIEAIRSKNNFSKKDLVFFESRLQQYKNM